MKYEDIVEDKWRMFQCKKCFARFQGYRVKINKKTQELVCPIDHTPVKQLLGNAGLDASAEMGG